jgi:hypothetical protein
MNLGLTILEMNVMKMQRKNKYATFSNSILLFSSQHLAVKYKHFSKLE